VRTTRAALVALALAFAGTPAGAQPEQDDDGASAPVTPPDPGPTPAVAAPKASKNRLLDITTAGDRLVAVGQQGVILRSDDGATWIQAPVPTSVMLTRVHFTDDRSGWALGYDATILQTTDGGANWSIRHRDPAGRALYDVLFLDARHGLAVGAYGTMLETRDGGASWSARDDALTGLGMHLNALRRLGDGALLIAGERGLLARSADDGATWTLLDFPYAGSLFGALSHGERGAIVYGMRGNVWSAADVAATPALDPATWDPYSRETVTDPARLAALGWRKLDAPAQESLFGAVALGDGRALLVGVNGTTLRLDPGSGTLAPVKTPAAETLAGGVRVGDRVLAVGRRGVENLGDVE
jgi:hypothetical protein